MTGKLVMQKSPAIPGGMNIGADITEKWSPPPFEPFLKKIPASFGI
jgi:hypothetical protein